MKLETFLVLRISHTFFVTILPIIYQYDLQLAMSSSGTLDRNLIIAGTY